MELELYKNRCDSLQPSQTPTRKITPTRRSSSGVFMFRGETAIPYESTLERDFLIRKEFSLAVLDVIPQPVEVPFIGWDGKEYTYTPDFLVQYRLGDRGCFDCFPPMLAEVKPASEWRKHWRKWLPKWKAAYRYAKESGWVFHILDESRIRDQALENIRFLQRYKRMPFPAEVSRWILENVNRMGFADLDYILARHFQGIYRAEGIAHVWHLLAMRQLDCDITQPLSLSTELWVPSHD